MADYGIVSSRALADRRNWSVAGYESTRQGKKVFVPGFLTPRACPVCASNTWPIPNDGMMHAAGKVFVCEYCGHTALAEWSPTAYQERDAMALDAAANLGAKGAM